MNQEKILMLIYQMIVVQKIQYQYYPWSHPNWSLIPRPYFSRPLTKK